MTPAISPFPIILDFLARDTKPAYFPTARLGIRGSTKDRLIPFLSTSDKSRYAIIALNPPQEKPTRCNFPPFFSFRSINIVLSSLTRAEISSSIFSDAYDPGLRYISFHFVKLIPGHWGIINLLILFTNGLFSFILPSIFSKRSGKIPP